jgi:hypothetical protein
MKTSTALGVVFGAIVLTVAGLFLKAWILGIILSWFSVSLTIWQNLLIIILADLITGKLNVSSKSSN